MSKLNFSTPPAGDDFYLDEDFPAGQRKNHFRASSAFDYFAELL
jgi:hypothetical protein